MGITIEGMMVVGETGDNLVGVYEGFENLDEEYDMECCPEHYDADPEDCVDIKEGPRRLFDYSNAKLRRARRLYGFICSSAINLNQDIVYVLANRAQEKGLYSEKTEIRSVIFSLCRHAYNNSIHYDGIGGFGWYRWCDEFGEPWNSKPRKKKGKIVVRMR